MKKITREGGGRKSVTYHRDNGSSTTYNYKRGGFFGNYQYKGKTDRR